MLIPPRGEIMDKQLEPTKAMLRALDKAVPVGNVAIPAVLSMVPVIGPLVEGAIDETITAFQEKKRKELVDIILTSELITSERVNDVEFILNMAKTLEAVNRLATNDKVKYFANLIKNGYFSKTKIQSDVFDEFLHMISMLSYREIEHLCFLCHFQALNWGKKKSNAEYMQDLGRSFGERFSCGECDYLDAYNRLSSVGCVRRIMLVYPPQITRIQDGYHEDFQVSKMDLDVDYYIVPKEFIEFAKTIGE